jgi:hypothetical protein
LNRRVPIPDNGGTTRLIGTDWMRGEGESTRERPAGAVWPRRALVSLWLLAFALAGGALAARWDVVMARLAGPPAAGGALR